MSGAGQGAISTRAAEIRPFHVMALLARARELEAAGRSIIHMEIGEPDFATAAPIVAAGVAALQAGLTQYTPALGLPALRVAVADFYRQRYGVDVDPGRVVITPGASGALLLAVAVLADPAAEILMADPGYPCNRHFVRFMDARAVDIPVGPPQRYQLTAAQIEAHWGSNTRGVLLASPSNPTGTLIPERELTAIAEVVRRRGGCLLVDEIYHGLTYEVAARTALTIDNNSFIINSFSKYFGMTGWRIGWLVVPPAYIEAVERLAQNIFLAASTPAQHAALAAFRPETIAILEQRRVEFGRRRDFLVPALRDLGFDVPVVPDGAFYIYADAARYTEDSLGFARDALEQTGVAFTPGTDFSRDTRSRHVRFAYTTSIEQLTIGVERLAAFLKGR